MVSTLYNEKDANWLAQSHYCLVDGTRHNRLMPWAFGMRQATVAKTESVASSQREVRELSPKAHHSPHQAGQKKSHLRESHDNSGTNYHGYKEGDDTLEDCTQWHVFGHPANNINVRA